jgi:hypothetical protein
MHGAIRAGFREQGFSSAELDQLVEFSAGGSKAFDRHILDYVREAGD